MSEGKPHGTISIMGKFDFVVTVVSAGLLVVAQILLNLDKGAKKSQPSQPQSGVPVRGPLERRLGVAARGLAIVGVVSIFIMFVWHVAHR